MGHVQDRWYRPARDEQTGKIILNAKGKPVLEKTEQHGTGLRYKVRYFDPDGQERSRSFADKQKRRADDFLIEMESDKREGKYLDPNAGRKKFRQVAENWVKGQSPDLGTRQALNSRLESQIYPTFSAMSVGSIRPSTIRDWLGGLDEKKLSDNYKAVLFDAVSSVLDSAVDDKLIRENPCRAKTISRPARRSPAAVVWPEQRVRKLRSGLDGRYKIITPAGAGLGLRQGEILALSPEDIDRDEMVVNVQRQIRIVQRQLVFALPKRRKSRTVPLSESILAEFDEHEETYEPVSVTLPWMEPGGELVTARLYVTGEGGRVVSGDHFNKVAWRAGFRAAGLKYRSRIDGMHALRHFYASVLLAQGVSVKELAEYLGHADAGFTLRTYTHLLPSSHERARVAIDGVFGRPAAADGLEAA